MLAARETSKPLVAVLCAALLLLGSSTAMAKMFVVEIDGQRVIVDYWVDEEQAWQNTGETDFGYWPGLLKAPPPYEYKIWYPYLADTFDMTLDEQMEWIDGLVYAGIKDWRIAYFWDTTPMKASMLGELPLMQIRPVFGLDPHAYFPPTACGATKMDPFAPPYGCITVGRTGNEDGEKTGAIINPLVFEPLGSPMADWVLPDKRYVEEGRIARDSGPKFSVYYPLPRSDAQDHWFLFDNGVLMTNDDLNFNPVDTTIGQMSPVDEVTGEKPIGAWTVTEAMPQFRPRWHKFHSIAISDVEHATSDGIPEGSLVPVTIVSVYQDERRWKFPDAVIHSTDEAAVVYVRAKRSFRGDGRVYHIEFEAENERYVFKVGVPKRRPLRCRWWRKGCDPWKQVLIDGGPLYDSTVK